MPKEKAPDVSPSVIPVDYEADRVKEKNGIKTSILDLLRKESKYWSDRLKLTSEQISNLFPQITEEFLQIYDLMAEYSYREPVGLLAQRLVTEIHANDPTWQASLAGHFILCFLYVLEQQRKARGLALGYDTDNDQARFAALRIDDRLQFFESTDYADLRFTNIFQSAMNLDEELRRLPPAGQAEDPLRDQGYPVYVGYGPFPSFAQLEKECGQGRVGTLFDGRTWTKHELCQDMKEHADVKIFLLHRPEQSFNNLSDIEEYLKQMYKKGYRPATHEEMYEFQRVYPDLQKSYPIFGYGSFALDDSNARSVAVLNAYGGRPWLHGRWFGSMWRSDGRFLFVRK